MPDLTTSDRSEADNIRALATHDPEDLQGVAALLGVSDTAAASFVSTHADAIEAEATRMTLKGELLEPKARKLAQKLMDRMLVDVDSLDPLEAADLIKHPLRIIENADRVRMAKKADLNDGLPVFNFVFHTGGFTAELVEVVDAPAKTLTVPGGTGE